MMKIGIRVSLLCFLVFESIITSAAPRSVQDAKAIATKQIELLGMSADVRLVENRTVLKEVETSADKYYYVFNNGTDDGFVIVSGDDCMPEIVGYATDGSYDDSDMPENFAYFLSAYCETLNEVKAGDARAVVRVEDMISMREDETITPVSPLLGGIAWNQSAPYNNLCPVVNGVRCVAGCVATAMAQIMRYHNWPKTLPNDIPAYTCSSVGTVSGISAGVTYDWDNMRTSYNGGYTTAEATAVATLTYHCGVATEMQYSTSGSGTYAPVSAWSEYFGYDADLLQYLNAYAYSLAEWNEILQNELNNSRPVLYCGYSSTAGHAFVCDGVDSSGYYHINWGWGGSYNGYFDITVLNPTGRGIGGGSSSDGFSNNALIVVGITPDNGVTDEKLYYCSDLALLGQGTMSSGEVTRATTSDNFTFGVNFYVANYLEEEFDGKASVAIRDSDGTLTVIADTTDIELWGAENGNFGVSYLEATVNYNFGDGTYMIVPVYRTDADTTWTECSGADSFCILVNVDGTTLTTLGKLDVSVELKKLKIGNNDLTLTLTNQRESDYFGTLYLYFSMTQTLPTNAVSTISARVPAGTTKETTATVEMRSSYGYVWVIDDVGAVLVDAQRVPALSGVESVTENSGQFAVLGGDGYISVKSATQTAVEVYNIGGQLVDSFTVEAGDAHVLTVLPGVYVVNGQKVMVK